ncbi:MAG: phosphoglucosamine mutase [Gammaproteobacteria bacterium]
MKKKYFGTDGVRGKVGQSLINPEFVLKLGWAVGKVLANNTAGPRKVLIGKDTRISGYMLESALEAGLSAAGVEIDLLGPMPTPAIAYLTQTLRAQAGVVISASHNPHHDNGIKFFSSEGRKLPDELEQAIEYHLDQPMVIVDSANLGKARRIVDAPGRYIEFCKSTVPFSTGLSGLKIVLDCANGATYHIAPHVFSELGANVITLAAKPDGFNINQDCGATQPAQVQQKVLAEKADLGIAFDGDGDRVIMVDHQGAVLDGDELLFIIAKDCLKRNFPIGGVIGTVMSNLGLETALQQLKIAFARTKVGDRHINAKLQETGWLLGGEPSGHIIHRGATTTGDGIVAALQVLLAMCNHQQSLHDLKLGMRKYPQTIINVCVANSQQLIQQERITQAIKQAEAELQNNGRVLVRASGTEPMIRVMVEGQDAIAINNIAKQLASVVEDVATSFQ